jgi:tRNA pseudouridine13 synthase
MTLHFINFRLKPSIFSVSGTKDRRAVTTQRVSVYRVDKSKLVNLRIRGIWLSQFSYSDKKLQLGDNYGNRFSIILRLADIFLLWIYNHINFLRDIPSFLKEDDLRERIDKWEHHGFLNYFGSQRFGSCGVNTAEVGRCILAENWQLAVQMLLAQREEAKGFILALC